MYTLPLKRYPGFTLIEVLIALVILSVAITAIILTSSRMIKNTMYLQNKTIALWVGKEIINETIAGMIKPQNTDSIENETDMLGKQWKGILHLTPTPNPHIKKIQVDVILKSENKKLITLESYFYEKK